MSQKAKWLVYNNTGSYWLKLEHRPWTSSSDYYRIEYIKNKAFLSSCIPNTYSTGDKKSACLIIVKKMDTFEWEHN